MASMSFFVIDFIVNVLVNITSELNISEPIHTGRVSVPSIFPELPKTEDDFNSIGVLS